MAESRTVIYTALFERGFHSMTAYYEVHGNPAVALRFAVKVKACVEYIVRNPPACIPHGMVKGREFRKWHVRKFPAVIFFSIGDDGIIIIEGIYHLKQNIAARLSHDVK